MNEFKTFLEALADPSREECRQQLERVGGMYDPDSFNPRHVTAGLIGWRRKRLIIEQFVSGMTEEMLSEMMAE